MRATDRTWVAVTFAGVVGALALLPLTTDSSYVYAAWLMMAVLCVAAVLGARLRLAKALVNGIQVLLAAALAVSLAIGPGPSDVVWFARLVPLLRSGYAHILTQAAPMDPDPGARIILILVVVVLFLVAGVIADTLERPGWSLAPLLTLYLVPAIALRSDVNVWSFLVVVGGYLAILFADGLNADRRWTRNLSHDSATLVTGSKGIWRLGAVIALPTLVLAVILGLLLPTLSPTFVSSLRPNGSGPIQLVDPQLDLRKNLEQGANVQVLSYTTNKPTGSYLRLATLPALTAAGWAQAEVSLKQGALGSVPGVTSAPSGGSRITKIQIDDLRSMYLPAPYAPRAQDAAGEWSYDPSSLTIIATGSNRSQATDGLTYTVESWDVEPDGAALSNATVGVPAGQTMTLDVPADVPDSIVQLTKRVTAGIEAPALKAAAIQAFLRSAPFVYSVQGATGESSYQAMETFLLTTHTGYCVQFASAMALMARIAGIPTRVAVGFLPGTKSGDRWIVNSHDMHAWPELYFDGMGWVRFEPTPSVATAPSWTVVAPNQPSPSVSTVAAPTASTSQTTAQATPSVQASTSPAVTATTGGSHWLRWLLVAGVVVVLLLLLAAPMVVRRLVRRSRLRPTHDAYDAAANAWCEVRDTWLDHGHRWPRGTPRSVGQLVAARLPEDVAATALPRLVEAVEQSRYAETYAGPADLRQQVDEVLAGLDRTRSWPQRAGQWLLPASLGYGLRRWWRQVTARRPAQTTGVPDTLRPSEESDVAFRRPVGAGRPQA